MYYIKNKWKWRTKWITSCTYILLHITRLGVYSLLCNLVATSSHRYSIWVCPVVRAVFVARLVVKFVISHFKIENIRRVSERLMRRLRAIHEVHEEADSLACSISMHLTLSRLRLSGPYLVPHCTQYAGYSQNKTSSQSQNRIELQRHQQLKTRVMGLAPPSQLEGSLPRFYRAFLVQLSIPLAALFVVFVTTIVVGYLRCSTIIYSCCFVFLTLIFSY